MSKFTPLGLKAHFKHFFFTAISVLPHLFDTLLVNENKLSKIDDEIFNSNFQQLQQTGCPNIASVCDWTLLEFMAADKFNPNLPDPANFVPFGNDEILTCWHQPHEHNLHIISVTVFQFVSK